MRSVLSGFIPRGSIILAVASLGSYVLGLLRDRILARSFGASASLDSYNAAFLVPDFVFNVLVASGIAAAAVPLFIELRQRNRRDAFAYINAILIVSVFVMFVTGIVLALAAPFLSQIIVPGLDAEARALTTRLMRIIAFSPLLFAVSNAIGAMLVAEKHWLFYSLSPIMYNIGIITGVVFLAPRFGIVGVAYGTLIGAALHMAIRLVDALRSDWDWKTLRPLPIPELKRTLRLMAPKMVGHPVELMTFWLFTGFASLLAPGSITVLNFARNFQSVPVSLLGIAMSTAAFPSLAEAALVSPEQLRKMFYRTAGAILAASVAAAVFVYVVRRPLIQILLGGGAFGADAVARTALTLGFFCLAIPTESLSHLFARAFYATQNTVIPVTFSVASLVVAGVSAYYLIGVLDIAGLPIGFFLGSVVKTVGLFLMFRRRLTKPALSV